MKRIDDPYDAAKSAYPDGEPNTALELALKVSGPFIPPMAVVNEVREHFSQKAFKARVGALTDALNEKVEYESSERQKLGKTVSELQSRLNSREFTESFREACVQTLLTTDSKRVRRFGAILGGSVVADDWPQPSEDAITFIKAIAQLSEKDIQALGLLHTVFADVVTVYPNMDDPNPFTEKVQELLKVATEPNFHRDDFYAHCRRLEGFGLAMEVPRNPSRMAPGDYCFRPTRPGLRLLEFLDNEKTPARTSNRGS